MTKFNQCPNCNKKPGGGLLGGGLMKIYECKKCGTHCIVTSAATNGALIVGRKSDLSLVSVTGDNPLYLYSHAASLLFLLSIL
ncbi:MAG TPA: hypothetical protein ENI62_01395 [Gammaproteobacteria bacterium]|nr:hypothetical protein [Gammaproteobacteria bacterium]